MKPNFKPDTCPRCKQTTTYLLPIDKGTCDIVRKMAWYIRKKGINSVHPRKELEGSYLTSNQVGNMSRPRFHGLVAKTADGSRNYCLTTKGIRFLAGQEVPRYAIVSKTENRQIGYCDPNIFTTYISDHLPYWDGIDFTIQEGRVVFPDSPEQQELL